MLGLGSSLTQGSFVSDIILGIVSISGDTSPDEDTATTYTAAHTGDAADVTYSWSVSPSTGVTISSSTAQAPNITFPDPDVAYTVSCVLTSATAVDSPKTATLSVNTEALLFGTLTISGSTTPNEDTATAYSIAIDPNVASVAYSWSVSPTATISDATVVNPNITFPDPSTSYTVSCTISKTGYANKTQTLSVTTASVSQTLVASYNLNNDTGTGRSRSTLPTGWAVSGAGDFTLYGSTVNDNMSTAAGWFFNTQGTASTGTGADGAHAGGPDSVGTSITSGTQSTTTDNSDRYLYYEASGVGQGGSSVKRHVMRTAALDFSSYTTVTMTFWFHVSGAHFGNNNRGVGVAATTSATSASSANQAGTGLGFTSDTAGGATIAYTDQGGSSQNVVRIGDSGEVQANTSDDWIKATVDLSNAAGQSSVYIHFGMFTSHEETSNNFSQDAAIDSIAIIAS